MNKFSVLKFAMAFLDIDLATAVPLLKQVIKLASNDLEESDKYSLIAKGMRILYLNDIAKCESCLKQAENNNDLPCVIYYTNLLNFLNK